MAEPSTEPAAQGPPDRATLRRRLGLGIFLGLLVYAGFALWGDVGSLGEALRELNLWLIPAAMALSFANYLVRFVRWERYRGLLGVRLDRSTSFLIHLAGLALTVTPGKMGEAFKSWLIKEVEGSPVSRTAPIVIAERFTDLLGFLVLVAVGGLATAPEYAWVFWVTLAVCAVALFALGSRALGEWGCDLLARLPVIGGLAPKARTAFESTRVLMAWRELPGATLLATFGWGLECTGFWLVASSLVEGGLPWLFCVFTFALSAVAGAVLIIAPGGLGVTEGTMTGLLRSRYLALGLAEEAARGRAVSATLVIRLCTLWFAMGVGLVALSAFRRRRARAATSPRSPTGDRTSGA